MNIYFVLIKKEFLLSLKILIEKYKTYLLIYAAIYTSFSYKNDKLSDIYQIFLPFLKDHSSDYLYSYSIKKIILLDFETSLSLDYLLMHRKIGAFIGYSFHYNLIFSSIDYFFQDLFSVYEKHSYFGETNIFFDNSTCTEIILNCFLTIQELGDFNQTISKDTLSYIDHLFEEFISNGLELFIQ